MRVNRKILTSASLLVLIVLINPLLSAGVVKFFKFNNFLAQMLTGLVTISIYLFFYYLIEEKEKKRLKERLQTVVEGDYRQKIILAETSPYYFIIDFFNQFIFKIRMFFKEVVEASVLTAEKSADLKKDVEEVFQMTDNIRLASKEVAGGAEEQSLNLESVKESFGTLSAFIEQTNNHAGEAAVTSQEATEIASQGEELIAAFMEEFTKYNQMIMQIVEEINSLKNNFAQATQIVQIISGIAQQTNLLALNAAIEAARAGKEGKSFGVVAAEIRDLSVEVDQSAQKIGQILTNVDEQIQLIFVKTNQNREMITVQKKKAVRVNEKIAGLNRLVDNNYSKMDQLKEATGRVVNDLSKTQGAVETVASIAQQTAANSQEVTASAENQQDFLAEIGELASGLNSYAYQLQETLAARVMDKTMLNLCLQLKELGEEEGLSKDLLNRFKKKAAIDDIYITDPAGNFTLSTIDTILGENLYEINPWSRQFLEENHPVSIITPIHRRIEDDKLYKFAMILTEDKRVIEVGLSLEAMLAV